MHDSTPTCSAYNDDSREGLLPCDLFSEEDEYEQKETYILEHDTSDEYSLMSDKDVDEDSWIFMENTIYDISDEENNEPKTFVGFVDNHVYDIYNGGSFESLDDFIEDDIYEGFKEEIMDLVALGNFYVEEEHVVYPNDLFEPFINIINENIERKCSEDSYTMLQFQLLPSHAKVPYDVEQLYAYTISHHLMRFDHRYDGVVNPPHHVDLYIIPIKSWIE